MSAQPHRGCVQRWWCIYNLIRICLVAKDRAGGRVQAEVHAGCKCQRFLRQVSLLKKLPRFQSCYPMSMLGARGVKGGGTDQPLHIDCRASCGLFDEELEVGR